MERLKNRLPAADKLKRLIILFFVLATPGLSQV
jgi:hypothetical protein